MANHAGAQLSAMLRQFGSVTVMDVEFFEPGYDVDGKWSPSTTFEEPAIAKLDSLKITNINQEGPTKTVTGGMNADPLIKYGKTMTLEIQDALGRYDVLTGIYGASSHGDGILAITDGFSGPKTLVGDTFYIDQLTGKKQPTKVVIPLFLPDSLFNLTQDAEGDASVFDINGSIRAFTTDANYDVGGDGLYIQGGDKEFYFFATYEAYEALESLVSYPDADAAEYLAVTGGTQVKVGGTLALTAHTNVTGSVTWATGDVAIATVSAGVVTGVGVGNVAITATVGTKSAVKVIKVIPA